MVSRSDRITLWYLLEQQIWTIRDLVSFAHVTETLSDLDRDVLQQLLHKVENLIKRGRQEEVDAISTQR